MRSAVRISGVDIIGNVPWGTHFCLFYQTKEDLIDILVPYFKAGLENNEFCMWVTSQPLGIEDANEALKKAIPDLDIYLKKGQIEIIPYDHWYVKDGAFDSDRVLNGWVEKLNQALANGYDGLRLTGNTFWLEKKDWNDFVDYEEEVDRVLGNYRMIALCTYCLDRCSATEIIDVVANHQFALIKKKGKWEQIESSKSKQAEEIARQRLVEIEDLYRKAPVGLCVLDRELRWVRINEKLAEINGIPAVAHIGKRVRDLMPQLADEVEPEMLRILETGQSRLNIEIVSETPSKPGIKRSWLEQWLPIIDSRGNVTGLSIVVEETTERKKAEETLRQVTERERFLADVVENANMPFGVGAPDGRLLMFNQAFADLTGYSREELTQKQLTWATDLTPPEWREAEAAYLAEALRIRQPVRYEKEYLRKDETRVPIELFVQPIFDTTGNLLHYHSFLTDITERKRVEQERETTVEFLHLANENKGIVDLVHSAVKFFRERSGFEAVGIRLKDGDDYPYFEASGFPEEFIMLENSLCTRDSTGQIVRDSNGYPIHECMCGNIIHGRFDPSKPFFTERGSFYTNCTTELLATTTDADRQARTRNRCNSEGYESVALIALRVGEECLGLLQLNDSCKEKFFPETIALWERLADYLAVSLAKARAEEALREAYENLQVQSEKLQAQSEELQIQFEELQAQSEEIQVQNEELQAQSEEIQVQNEALVASEEKYRQLFENMLDGFAYCKMLYDDCGHPVDFIYLDTNSAFEHLTGLKGVKGKRATEAIPGVKESQPELFDTYGRVALTGRPEKFEIEFKPLGIWLSISVYSTKKDHFVAIFDNITERKRAEETLRENGMHRKVAETVENERQRLNSVLDKLPVYVILLSPDYHVPFANRFFEKRFGKSEGRRCYEYLFQRAEPCENCETFKVFKTCAPHHWEWTGPDGRNYDIYDYPFNDSEGSSLIMEVGIDITEMKQAHMTVQAERQRLFNVLETLPVMICMLTSDYHVTFANSGFREKFGESEGRHCYEYCFGLTKPCEFCESYKVLETGQPHHWEVTGPDGSVIDAYDFPFTDVDGSPLILEMDIDITEHRKAEEALKKIDDARIKEIHHRIKNNLQVISSLLSLEAERFNDIKVLGAFKDSQNRVASMALIHEELYRSKGPDDLDFAAYLRKLTENLLNSYNLRNNGISLKSNFEQVNLNMDTAIPLGIIVNELVSNSLKHAFPSGRKGEISISLERTNYSNINIKNCNVENEYGAKDNFHYVLTVADNGKGILEGITLQTVDSLGLQLVSILVEQIDGYVELKRDHGTEFVIWFNNMGK